MQRALALALAGWGAVTRWPQRRRSSCAFQHAQVQPWLLDGAVSAAGEPPPEMMAYLRLRHLGGADAFLLEAIFRSALWAEHLQLPVSRENEELSMRDGLGRCNEARATRAGKVGRPSCHVPHVPS